MNALRVCLAPDRLLFLIALICTTQACGQVQFNLTAGWNLLANSSAAPIDVAVTFGDAAKIKTVWKWNKAGGKWAFYAPSLPDGGAAYASSNGYDPLTSIAPKEGFWVNASTAVAITGPVASGVTLVASDLSGSWDLVGSADGVLPSQLSQNLRSSLDAAGKQIVTVWAWDNIHSPPGWKFYAPALEARGGTALADYITRNGYLGFTSPVSATEGLWLNVGASAVPPCPTSAGPLALSMVASRNSGAAPLAVFFDATGTTSTGVTTRPFHEIEYRWDFGDTGSGFWGDQSTGSSGSTANTSRNASYGPIAAHVFDAAGTYLVKVTAFDGANTASCSTSITANAWVNDANTVCVSTDGTFTGCPSGATHAANTSNFVTAIGNITSSRKRLLFRCGQAWTASSTGAIAQNGPGLIGAYNDSGMVTSTNKSCIKPKVTLSGGATAVSNSGARADWRVLDLEIDGRDVAGTSGVVVGQGPGANQWLMQRLNIHNTGTTAVFSDGFGNPLQENALVDSTITHWNAGVGIWSEDNYKLTIMGNTIHDAVASGEHCIRAMGPDKIVISHNSVRDAGGPGAGGKENLTVRGTDEGSFRDANKILIADNKSQAISGNTYALMAHTGNVNDMITERNWLVFGKVGSGIRFEEGWLPGVQNRMTVRNNLFDANGTTTDYIGVLYGVSGNSGGAVYNNSFYNGNSSSSAFTAVVIGSGVSGTVVKNNVAYAPNMGTNATFLDNAGTGTAASNNSSDAQMRATTPRFTTTPPTQPSYWKPTCTSGYPCAQGTSVPAWSDFYGAAGPGTRDIGAMNH